LKLFFFAGRWSTRCRRPPAAAITTGIVATSISRPGNGHANWEELASITTNLHPSIKNK
jgi:hypothetical protein